MVITIEDENLEMIFSNLKVIKQLRDIYKKNGDELQYEKYLSEFCGIYGVIVLLGLEEEWQQYQIKHWNDK